MDVVVLHVDDPVLDALVLPVFVAGDVHGPARGPGHLIVGDQDPGASGIEHGICSPVSGDAHTVNIVIRDGDILVIRSNMEDSVIS